MLALPLFRGLQASSKGGACMPLVALCRKLEADPEFLSRCLATAQMLPTRHRGRHLWRKQVRLEGLQKQPACCHRAHRQGNTRKLLQSVLPPNEAGSRDGQLGYRADKHIRRFVLRAVVWRWKQTALTAKTKRGVSNTQTSAKQVVNALCTTTPCSS